MNVVFHALASFGIAHTAARGMNEQEPPATWRDAGRLAAAFVAGVLSHGVLDGLKHGYPIHYEIDPPLALVFLGVWLALVRRDHRVLVVVAFLGAVLPDLVDLGPAVANHLFGWHLPKRPHLFPWHLLDGSGSMYPAKGRPAAGCRPFLDAGDNQLVSITNHAIVVAFSLAAIAANTRPFRFARQP
jgi:hypothetical protein